MTAFADPQDQNAHRQRKETSHGQCQRQSRQNQGFNSLQQFRHHTCFIAAGFAVPYRKPRHYQKDPQRVRISQTALKPRHIVCKSFLHKLKNTVNRDKGCPQRAQTVQPEPLLLRQIRYYKIYNGVDDLRIEETVKHIAECMQQRERVKNFINDHRDQYP